MTRLTLLDAPSNLGLRPAVARQPPGCRGAPRALRGHDLLSRLGASDAGEVPAPAYADFTWQPGDGVRHAAEIGAYSRRLADRVVALREAGDTPIVLGGDCSILLGILLGLRRQGRFGLICLDGPDFRHPGNSPQVGAAAGESLALVTGRGGTDLTDLDGLAPYVRDDDVALWGMREDDEFRAEVAQVFQAITAAEIATDPAAAIAPVLAQVSAPELAGFWVHLDVDVLDPTVMPAVDTPEPGGLDHSQLLRLLTPLLAAPGWVGLDVTIYDPTLDPTGAAGRAIVDTLVAAVTAAHA